MVHLPSVEVNPETVDISVTVTDGTDPVSGVEVAIGSISSTTGSAGGCTLNDVPVGSATITATKTGYENYSESVTITSETETLSITLTEE